MCHINLGYMCYLGHMCHIDSGFDIGTFLIFACFAARESCSFFCNSSATFFFLSFNVSIWVGVEG